jgi:hypothetical protein
MLYYVDLVLRVGRLLGTFRALIIQTNDLLDYMNLTDALVEDLGTGHEF